MYAIGNPKGLSNTISEGIVSALRSDEGEELIQHTAPISHGSSGGALVDSNGALLGMNSWQVANGQNLNFAIAAKHLVAALATARQNTTALKLPSDEPPSASDKEPAPKSDRASSIPRDWVDPTESPAHTQKVQVSVMDPYVYLQWTMSASYPSGILSRKQTCDTKKAGDEWVGRCVAAFTLDSSGYNGLPICDGIEQQVVITLLTEGRIEARIEHLEFPKDFPIACPVVRRGDWRTLTLIPKL